MPEERQELVTGYGRALYTAAEAEGVLDRVADEMFQFARSVDASRALEDKLTNPGTGVGAKLEVVEQLLGGRAHPVTTGGVLLIIQAGHARQLGQIADEIARQAAEARSRVLAQVRTAVQMDDAQRRRLAQALSQATGKEVELKVIVDPTVVGGIVAKVGDTVIDGSVSRRLADLKARLTG